MSNEPKLLRNCFFSLKRGGQWTITRQCKQGTTKETQMGVSFHVTCYMSALSDNMHMNMTVFPTFGCHVAIGAKLWCHCDLDTIASAQQHSRHLQEGAVQIWDQSNWDIAIVVSSSHFFWSDQLRLRHGLRTDPITAHHPVCPGHSKHDY